MRLISALTGSAIIATGLVAAQPALAEPDIDTVKARVDRLYHEAEVAQERYNDLQLDLEALRKDLKSLRADEARQQDKLDAAQVAVEDSVISQYQGEGMATVGDVLVSEDPAAFLSDLSALSSVNDLQTRQLAEFATQRRALELRAEATRERVDEVAAAERKADREQDTVDAKLADAKELLAELEAEERAQVVSRSSESREPVPTSVPASGRAGAAVSYALAQVGDAYVYGATGESAFDCSGLTMRAWAQAGVSLPHSSSAQMGSGPSVPSSQLQPGDLVFYYSPVSHVGIYIGGGRIVHAANPSTGVQVTGVFSMPFSGAVRPG